MHERGEREGSACYKSRCFCNPPTIFSTNPIMSLSIRDQSQVRGFSAWSELNYFVYRKLSSWDVVKWYHNRVKWNIFTVPAPAANTTNIDYKQSLIFYCSQSMTNNHQFRVHTQDLLSYNLIKHHDGHKEQNTGQPDTRIMKVKENYKQLSKSSTDNFYQSFSSLFANHLKLNSRWYMFLRKRRSFEYQHCRCLARITIALNRCSVYGQMQYTKPPEHLCLLNKPLQLVLVRVLSWSCYMIGVILIFQSLCQ